MRRKGEARVKRTWPEWGPDHPIHNMIEGGTPWFAAWYMQACTPWPVISRKTGISQERLFALEAKATPTDDEVTALAKLWGCPVAQLHASFGD